MVRGVYDEMDTSGEKRMRGKSLAFSIMIAGVLTTAACSGGEKKSEDAAGNTGATAAAEAPAAAANAAAAAGGAAAAPTADNVDTLSGAKFAEVTGDAAKGEAVFIQCKTCHVTDPGQNRIGPSLHQVVGRAAGTVAGFNYSPANKNSGITWSKEKLFQYLENPQRVVPGTKMAFAGIADPQKRADLIEWLATK
jgi:cytochrome c